MNKIFSLALMALLFASCQNSTDDNDLSDDATTTTETSAAPATTEPVTLNPVGDEALNAVPAPAPAGGNAEGKVALNPEHGLPGHRCDIPVGAPLNSPAGAAPAAPAINAAPAMAPQPSAAPAVSQPAAGGGRVNPPHGQPGHDCAVPVGAPLNG